MPSVVLDCINSCSLPPFYIQFSTNQFFKKSAHLTAHLNALGSKFDLGVK